MFTFPAGGAAAPPRPRAMHSSQTSELGQTLIITERKLKDIKERERKKKTDLWRQPIN